MLDSHLSRVIIVNFISAVIISLMTINLTDVTHIADLFGLYFLVIFGIDIMIESRDIRNDRQRFILAIALILIFDLVFLLIVPLLFGNVLGVTDSMIFVFNGARFDFSFNVYTYLAIYAILMIIFNILLYLKDRQKA